MVMALLRRWLYTPIIIWQGDWIPRDLWRLFLRWFSGSTWGGPEMSCVSPNCIHWVLAYNSYNFQKSQEKISPPECCTKFSVGYYISSPLFHFLGGDPSDIQWLWFLLLRENHCQGLRLRVLFFEDPFLHAKIAMWQCVCFGATKAANKNTPKIAKKQVSWEYFLGGWKVMGIRETQQKCSINSGFSYW